MKWDKTVCQAIIDFDTSTPKQQAILYPLFKSKVLRLCENIALNYTNNYSTIAILKYEALAHLIQRLSKFDKQQEYYKIFTYSYTIINNFYIDWYRKKQTDKLGKHIQHISDTDIDIADTNISESIIIDVYEFFNERLSMVKRINPKSITEKTELSKHIEFLTLTIEYIGNYQAFDLQGYVDYLTTNTKYTKYGICKYVYTYFKVNAWLGNENSAIIKDYEKQKYGVLNADMTHNMTQNRKKHFKNNFNNYVFY
jgi:hypothetical protein